MALATDAELKPVLETLMFKDSGRRTILEAPGEAQAEVSFSPARAGGWGVRRQGVTLASSYAPGRQARTLVESLDVQGVQLLVVVGCGGGALPLEVCKLARAIDAQVAVLEPDPTVLLGVLRRERRLWSLDERRVQFFTSAQSLQMHVAHVFRPGGGRALVVCPPASQRAYIETLRELPRALESGMVLAAINRNTASVRARKWVDNLLRNLGRSTEHPSIFSMEGAFAGVPAVVVAAGPSLDRNVEQLAKIADKALIICVNTSFKALLAKGITPHLVLSLESLDVSSHFVGQEEALARTTLVLDRACHPRLYDLPAARKFGFLACSYSHMSFAMKVLDQAQVRGLPSGGSIANAAFSCANLLGCHPIALIGQDLAYTGGQAYASGTIFEDIRMETEGECGRLVDPTGIKQQILDDSQTVGSLATFQAERDLLPVKAWSGQGQVWTSMDFELFRVWFQEAAAHIKGERDVRLINATEGGAHIDNFEHLPLAQVIDEHIGGRQGRDFHAEINALHVDAPRPGPGRWSQGLAEAVADCRRLVDNARNAQRAVVRAEGVLRTQGHGHRGFEKALERLEGLEARVIEGSYDSPLVESCVQATLNDLMDQHSKASLPEGSQARWSQNLQQTREVLEAVIEAAGELLEQLEAAHKLSVP